MIDRLVRHAEVVAVGKGDKAEQSATQADQATNDAAAARRWTSPRSRRPPEMVINRRTIARITPSTT